MRIVTYLFGLKSKGGMESLTHNNLFDVLRETEGKWCRPFIENRVGTVLFEVHCDRVFCRSLMKPTRVNSIPIKIEVAVGDLVSVKARLPLDFEYDDENLADLLIEHGCEASDITYEKLPFGSISFKCKGEMVDIPCGDFNFVIKINNLEGFKKAYLQGIGTYKECGCGMITVKNIRSINK